MAGINKRDDSAYWQATWYDANGEPHHRSTKVRIVPKGSFDIGERTHLEKESHKKAQAIADEWERQDRGNATAAQGHKVVAEIADRRFPGEDLKDIPTTKLFLVDYLDQKLDEIEGTTAKLYLGHLTSFITYLGQRADLPVTTNTSEVFKGYLIHEKKENGSSTCTLLGRWSFLYYAFETLTGKFFLDNPVAGADRPKETDYSTRRPLEAAELPKLLSAALNYPNGKEWVTIILFALYLGLRLSDAIRMDWSMINWEEAYVDYSQFKLRRLKKEERGPLHDDLLRWLLWIREDKKKGPITPVLAERDATLSTSFHRIVERAGIDSGAVKRLSGLTTHKVVFHSLRHTIITWLDDLGVPETHREELVGHAGQRNHRVHKKYSHTRLKGLRRTVAKLPSVATGVVPLADLPKPNPTSSSLLSDEVRQQFAHIRKMAASGQINAADHDRELNNLEVLFQVQLRNNLQP